MKNQLYLFLGLSILMLFNACQTNPPKLVEKSNGFLSINGAEIFYQKMGSGEPILFIHGGPSLEHGYLLPQMEALAQDYQLIFYDQRTCGKSTAMPDSSTITLDGFIEDIESIRKALKLEKVNILGHSWGGFLAMHYAMRYPDNLKKLLLINSVGASSAQKIEEQVMINKRKMPWDSLARIKIIQSEAFKKRQAFAFEDMFRLSFKRTFFDTLLVDSLTLSLPADFGARSTHLFTHLAKDIMAYEFYGDLKKITVPTLILYGDYDPLSEIAGKDLANNITNSELVILKDCGHFPYIEKPALFFESIRRFVDAK